MDEDKYMKPIHPGEILNKEFLEPLGLSQNELARQIGVPPRRVNEIVLEKRGITADTAMRLSKFFGTSAQFWLNLQANYDLKELLFHSPTRTLNSNSPEARCLATKDT